MSKKNKTTAKNEKVEMKIYSRGIKPKKMINRKFICTNQGGKNLSPDISWKPVKNAASYVLLAFDPDAPSGTWVHWILTYIPPTLTRLPVLPASKDRQMKVYNEMVRQGVNSWGEVGYGGPCPPPGKAHRYYFVVYALDMALQTNSNSVEKFLERIKGHVIGKGHIMGIHKRA